MCVLGVEGSEKKSAPPQDNFWNSPKTLHKNTSFREFISEKPRIRSSAKKKTQTNKKIPYHPITYSMGEEKPLPAVQTAADPGQGRERESSLQVQDGSAAELWQHPGQWVCTLNTSRVDSIVLSNWFIKLLATETEWCSAIVSPS